MFRILAIEPDSERGKHLARLIRDRIDADIEVVVSAGEAVAAMARQMPDLIVTSALLAPSDEGQLTAHLKTLPEARDVPVLTVPPVVDPDELTQHRYSRRISSFRRRGAPPWPAYDAEALGIRIRDARDAVLETWSTRAFTPAVTSVLLEAPESDGGWDGFEEHLLRHCPLDIKRARAQRFAASDVPWLTSVSMPWGLRVRLLNISSSGLLIESGSKLDLGSATAFHLAGRNTYFVVPACIVRSHVAAVDPRGVKYRAAALFEWPIDSGLLAPVVADVVNGW